MYIETLCTPAILFVMLMMFHVIFELFDEHYSMALMKFICSIIVIVFLQLLCSAHMEIIAWVIVFLPLIIYSYMTFLLFFVFGTDPSPAIKQFEVK
jgi:hypothetical protein